MGSIRQASYSDIAQCENICIKTADEKLRANDRISRITAKTYCDYYIREEAKHCFVIDDGGVQGYILCAPDYRRFKKTFRKIDVKKIAEISVLWGIFAYFLPLGYMPFSKKYPAHLHIDILESYRSQGMGSKMISTLTDKLKSENVPGVMLIASSKNTEAHRFYKRNGFHKIITAFGMTIMAKQLN
jgi:ribosomal protein S18 acetylase RimI-like enzyme